jgi:hypothetical protein
MFIVHLLSPLHLGRRRMIIDWPFVERSVKTVPLQAAEAVIVKPDASAHVVELASPSVPAPPSISNEAIR